MKSDASATNKCFQRLGFSVLICFWLVGCSREFGWKQVSQDEPARMVTWTPSQFPSLFGLSSVGSNGLWAVGERGTILHSTDGGASWQTQNSGTKLGLTAIYGSGKDLWAVGREGTILHSDDGATWQPQHSGSEELEAIYGSGKELCAVGTHGIILYSADGGTNWQQQKIGKASLRAIFGSGKEVWAVGDSGTILHSGDGGANWQTQNSGTSGSLSAIYGSGQELWIVGQGGTIFHSGDSGATWQPQTNLQERPYFFLRAVYGSGKKLWAVGDKGTILHSTDGAHWQPQRSGTVVSLRAVYGDGKELWVVGEHGAILHSGNEGTTWQLQTSGGLSFGAIYGSGNELWILDIQGTIWHSGDDGASWEQQSSGRQGEFDAIYGSGKDLWIVDGSNGILHSSDGGANWEPQDSGTKEVLSAIYGRGKELWVAGGTILHSRDGGATWQEQIGTDEFDYLSAIYGSGKDLWAVGREGTILHSDDGATWQPQHSGTDEELEAIYGSGKELCAVGTHGIILYSADGGTNWQQQKIGKASLRAIFGSGKEVWAVGDSGTILHSGDGGINWQPQPGGTEEALTAIYGSGNKLWVVGRDGIILRGKASGSYPSVRQARLLDELTNVRLEFEVDYPGGDPASPNITPRLFGANHNNFEDGIRNQPVDAAQLFRPHSGSSIWAFTFDPAGSPLHVGSGQVMHLAIQLSCDDFTQRFPFQAFTYQPWAWLQKNSPWLGPTVVLILISLAFTVLLFTWPLTLLNLYRNAGIYQLVEKLPAPGLAEILKGALKFTLLPIFIRHPRTLDAWVEKHFEGVQNRFEEEDVVQRSQGYVALPVFDSRGKSVIETPSAGLLSAFFTPRRSVVQIVGHGGMGKTMLAIQIGRWALNRENAKRSAHHRMLPILIDEDTEDLPKVIRRKLTSWLGEKIETELSEALLEKKRLLVIVDRLSERKEGTREHVRTIHGSVPVNALLVTSRYSLRFEAGGSITLAPRPLNSANLLNFMTSLLQSSAEHGAFSKLEDQLDLGSRLSKLIQVAGTEVPLTPLLVRRFVEEALRLWKANISLDQLPGSVPEVYFDYLRSVNPLGPGVANQMPNDEMLRAAEALSKLSLGDDFVPKEFAKPKAQELLARMGWKEPDKLDPVQRLIDNGVLIKRSTAATTLLRFALDPIAEYLAATAWAMECGNDGLHWGTLIDRVRAQGEGAVGFLTSLHLVWQAYGSEFNWPKSLDWSE